MDKKNQEAIKFYILIPVYKTEQYIHACMNSVLKQTYSNFEVIVVDDGTPDKAGEICDDYAKKDKRVHVVHKENEGLVSARRTAISYVKRNQSGEQVYVVFLDSDDYLEQDALCTIANTILDEDCDLVIYGIQRVFEGKVVGKLSDKSFLGCISDKKLLYKTVFLNMEYNPLCRKAISLALIQNNDWSKYYHIRHGEDLLQSIPIYKACRKAAFIEDVLYNYTVNPNSITQSVSLDTFEIESTVRNSVYKFLVKENVFSEQDMNLYLAQCMKFLYKKLLEIGSLPGEKKKKEYLYKQIAADDYYKMLLERKSMNFVLSCMKLERYDWIIIFAGIRRKLATFYHRMISRA